MKYTLISLLIFLSTGLMGQINIENLKGDWILVNYSESNSLDERSIFGYILRFNEKGMISIDIQESTFVSFNDLESSLKQENKKIYSISEDSLIVTGHIYLSLEKPIAIITDNELIKLLYEYSWKLGENSTETIKFLKHFITNIENFEFRHYLIEDSNGFFVENDYWMIYSHEDLIFLLTNNRIFLISDINNGRIYTISYTEKGKERIVFSPKPMISSKKLDNIENLLTSKQWKSRKKEFKGGFEGKPYEVNSTDFSILPNILNHSIAYPRFDLFSILRLRYYFNKNGDYIIQSRRKIIKQGKWEISKDGNYIVLEKGNENEYYIRIIEISEENIKLAQTLALRMDRKQNDLYLMNFLIELK